MSVLDTPHHTELIGHEQPCFGAALVGCVEATLDDDQDKNRCPPSPYSDRSMSWGRMYVGLRSPCLHTVHLASSQQSVTNTVPFTQAHVPTGPRQLT